MFYHSSVVRSEWEPRKDDEVAIRIVADPTEGTNKFKAVELWRRADLEAQLAIEEAIRTAKEAAAAAEEVARKAQSARLVNIPPGLGFREKSPSTTTGLSMLPHNNPNVTSPPWQRRRYNRNRDRDP